MGNIQQSREARPE